MSSVNKAVIVGRLGQDPEIRYMPNGDAVTNLSIATSESWKDKSGAKQERTEWHRVVMFRKLAEIAGEYLRKGSLVYIEGKIQTKSYDKDGVKHYSTEIIANEMTMLSSRSDNEQNQTNDTNQHQQNQQAQQQNQTTQAPRNSFDDFDDDIPF